MSRRTDTERAALAQAHQLGRAEARVVSLEEGIDDVRGARDSIDANLSHLEAEATALRAVLGIDHGAVPDGADALVLFEPTSHELAAIEASLPTFESLRTIPFVDERAYQAALERYAQEESVDLDDDPITALLPPNEIAAIRSAWSQDTARLSWDRWDYALVGGAAIIGAVLDIVLVSVPPGSSWRGVQYAGSPLTKFFRERSSAVIDGDGWLSRVQRSLERWAKVPFDIARNDGVRGIHIGGLRPDMHRIMSPGHDPVLGFIFGVLDLLRGTCTLIDNLGVPHTIENGTGVSLPVALLKLVAHLLSDIPTPRGLPSPFFTALQKIIAKTPWAIRTDGEAQSVADLTRWMYGQGYDLRHFATMSVVPLVVESVVHVGFFARHHEALMAPGPTAPNLSLKRNEMLLAAHGVAASTNALKVALMQGNPLAINQATWMSLAVHVLRWLRSRAEHDRAVERDLVDGWRAILHPHSQPRGG